MNESIEIPWITRFTIASNVASGMKYLHNHNIMHRDLTSSVREGVCCVVSLSSCYISLNICHIFVVGCF